MRGSLKLAPVLSEGHVHGTLNDSYIVVLKNELSPSLKDNHFNFLQLAHSESPLLGGVTGGLRHVYESINGYAGQFSESTIERLRELPEVEYIERDQIVRTTEFAVHDVSTMEETTVQKRAPWGLARVSHRPKLSFGTFSKYEYIPEGGEGVDVYVIDTGINIDHVELKGRARWGKTMPDNDVDEDGNGHGSHCAGTIAGSTYGVAKAANVVAVKVLGSNGSGSMSDVVRGVEWATLDAKKTKAAAEAELKATGKTSYKGSVANMSLGGGKSKALDDTVNAAVDAGLHFAVAAGNDNRDSCNYSPAGAEKAVTVMASTLSDERAYFSNFGKCSDVFAPGLNILSIYKGSPTAVATLSGTSMASPHVAGMLAYLLSIYPSKTFNPVFGKDMFVDFAPEHGLQSPLSLYGLARTALPRWISAFLPAPEIIAPIPDKPSTLTTAQLKSALITLASEDLLDNVGSGSPNLLIFNNATA
ncbi:hypothetical protein CYLTODRAFT_370605 [Cylindrobasidium torrendii FP15055 ss-10]|uniref:Subtilisin-like protein n=1 Tax=Cylindrobasidium torrendii FP15055 ss-10 TaxID=1314674 RepID=A0A0D7BM99_9AGAR|nr:hypothetical protein CYLTODRAFT_370605 [Cylindrobasidium torrendii FP15055 ss-10]